MDTSGIETGVGRTIRTLLEVRQETKAQFLVGTIILGFLSIFKKSQASSPFDSLKSVCLLGCQRDLIPPIKMRRRTMAFSRVSTRDSDMPSSCEMKDEPEFKPLQGSRDIFESGPLGVHSTWERKHRVPLTSLLLRENAS